MIGTDIAIDLGTYGIKIYVDGKGIVVNEPNVVAVRVENEEVIAIGSEAYAMLGRTSDRVKVIRPLVHGVISNFDLARYILDRYIRQVGGTRMVMPRVVVSLPCQITAVEQRAVVNAISSVGVRRVYSIPEPVAAAIGARIDVCTPHSTLAIHIGGGTTDMGVISLGGLSISQSLKVAGISFDDAIIRYVRRTYDLIIGERMAEDCKIAIGGVLDRPQPAVYRVKGRDANTGLPAFVDLQSSELIEPFLDPALEIVRVLQGMLEKTPPELLGDVYVDGIVMTGGTAQLYGLDQFIADKVKMPVHVAQDADICVTLGAGQSMKFIEDMDNKQYGVVNPLSEVY